MFRWRAIIWILSPLINKKNNNNKNNNKMKKKMSELSWTHSDKTFWIRAWLHKVDLKIAPQKCRIRQMFPLHKEPTSQWCQWLICDCDITSFNSEGLLLTLYVNHLLLTDDSNEMPSSLPHPQKRRRLLQSRLAFLRVHLNMCHNIYCSHLASHQSSMCLVFY